MIPPDLAAVSIEPDFRKGGMAGWRLTRVIEHMQADVSRKLAVSDLIETSGLSRAQFFRAFKQSTGLTPRRYLAALDPKQISLGEILRIFFSVATDPTQLNMQYPDHGTQYRNEIFYSNADQKRVAEAYIAQLDKAKVFNKKIVTRVDANPGFFPAEAYHQNYLTLHPDQPYIAAYDMPKVEDLKRLFPARYSAKPVLVGA